MIDRRQLVLDAIHDDQSEVAADLAVEVELTTVMLEAGEAADSDLSYGTDYSAIITAALTAAGFTVIDR
jgi:hypothetical protein